MKEPKKKLASQFEFFYLKCVVYPIAWIYVTFLLGKRSFAKQLSTCRAAFFHKKAQLHKKLIWNSARVYVFLLLSWRRIKIPSLPKLEPARGIAFALVLALAMPFFPAPQNVFAEADTGAPTVESAVITPSGISHTAVTLTWNQATDDITSQTDLQYKVVYSLSDNIASTEAAITNGSTATDWTANITSSAITGLTKKTTYYYNVLVKDAAGNIAAYDAISQNTLRGPVAVFGGSGNTELFLGGNYIELGISNWGDLGTEGTRPAGTLRGTTSSYGGMDKIGMSADFDGYYNGYDMPIDFYLPGSPEERFAVGYQMGSTTAANSNSALNGAKNMATTVENQSITSSGILKAKIISTWTDKMEITQVISFGVEDKFYKNEVSIKNISSEDWDSARYMRTFDPDNTVFQGGQYATDNVVTHTIAADQKAVVVAKTWDDNDPIYQTFGSRAPIFFYSKDPAAVASTFGFANQDPYNAMAYETPSPKGEVLRYDRAITITWDSGALNAGATKSFTYYTSLDDRDFSVVEQQIVAEIFSSGGGYNVRYQGNGATGGTEPSDTNAYPSGTAITVLGNTGALEKTGFTFEGWNTAEDGSGTTYSAGSSITMGESDLTLYAVWEEVVAPPPTPTPKTNTPTIQSQVLMEGVSLRPGTVEVTYEEGKKITSIDANTAILEKIDQLTESAPDPDADTPTTAKEITIDVSRLKSDKVEVKLTGDVVEGMGRKDLTLNIIDNDIRHLIPAADIDVKAITEALGLGDQIEKVEFTIVIETPDTGTTTRLQETADKAGYEIVLPPMNFEVQATNLETGDQSVVKRFTNYAGRLFQIPDGIDPGKITTGIVFNPDGTVNHVPTSVITIDGVYYARISSLTNSTYSVIWHPLTYSDMAGHWAMESANNMGSRLVMEGDPQGNFNPESSMTRGDFVTILTKALGLYHAREGVERFGDVETGNPYYDVIGISLDYGLLYGYPDGTFQPDRILNRQEMMVILAKAAALLKLEAVNDKTVRDFLDYAQASLWAEGYLNQNIRYGLIQGYNGLLRPTDAATRAEVAVALEALLKLAGLIN